MGDQLPTLPSSAGACGPPRHGEGPRLRRLRERPAERGPSPPGGAVRPEDRDDHGGGATPGGGRASRPAGRLLAAGGTRRYDGFLGLPVPPFRGLNQSYLFEPRTGWSRAPDMRRGRWYPTLVALAAGRGLAVAGLTSHFPWAFLRRIEVFDPGTGWSKLRHASRWMPLYPRLHLLPDGRVFYSGSYNTHLTFPFS